MRRADDATRAQIGAADPSASTWLSANAGSGKTRVLTDRVARLLLDLVPPQNILCLTFTKAAAGEMQNRLFARLGSWAMLPDEKLHQQLDLLGYEGNRDLAHARTLFARAIETPGGLKIQTIHSFCAAILRQFPLEAGVSPGFRELDERTQGHLLETALNRVSETDASDCVTNLVRLAPTLDIAAFATEIARRREAFADAPDDATLRRQCNAPEEEKWSAQLRATRLDPACATRLLAALATGSANDVRAAGQLSAVSLDAPSEDTDLPILERVFLTGEKAKQPFSAKVGSFPTKKTRDLLGPDMDAIDAFMRAVESARPARLARQLFHRTRALIAFGQALLSEYEAEKTAQGFVDFDDLIHLTRNLLSDRAASAWVRFKLDGRIDHVLVDEAQDTSPAQWAVVENLVEEFGAGEGARGLFRTLFVVGDKKQSIYSFQGADARAFDTKRQDFGERLRAAGGLSSRELIYSFRSSPAILRAVDRVSQATSLENSADHIAYHADLPGRVDLWPLVEADASEEEAPWFDPVDRIAPNHPSGRLAEKIATRIRQMVDDPSHLLPMPDGGARRITEGDILILVQGRTGSGGLFNRLITACKARGLRVAGADRMKIRSELAVKDLLALLSFLALPEDDLSLAAALRSPLFSWSEQDLFSLANRRGNRFLWQALREARPHEATSSVLDDLRNAAEFTRPYELLERILNRHNGRHNLIARLGEEVEDAIDELLRQALEYERIAVPSLTGFLTWLEGEDLEVKRSSEGGRDQIQVMTVHGAKGLERPIVILPDTMRTEQAVRDSILMSPGGIPLWKPGSGDMPNTLTDTVDAVRTAAREERDRLLYVAMTRAEKWLILAGAGDASKQDGTWYGHLAHALDDLGGASVEDGLGMPILRYETGIWPRPTDEPEELAHPEPPALPDWANRRPTAAPARETALSPSDLGGAKVLPVEEADPTALDAALERGRRIHLLLEHLPGVPPAKREAMATALLRDAPEYALSHANEVGAILDAPDLKHLFAPDALAEVAFTARLDVLGGRWMRGAIDRLIFTDDGLLAVDFKTNRLVPETPEMVPEGILRQMGAYAAALREIYPERCITPAILWTANASVMVLPNDIVMEALRRAATS